MVARTAIEKKYVEALVAAGEAMVVLRYMSYRRQPNGKRVACEVWHVWAI